MNMDEMIEVVSSASAALLAEAGSMERAAAVLEADGMSQLGSIRSAAARDLRERGAALVSAEG